MTAWLSSTAGEGIRFETTQWSLVTAAAAEEERRNALEGLYRTYSASVYCFIRRRGYGRQDAQDLTQDFFIHLVERNTFRRADPNRGKFRTFLLGALESFLQHASRDARAEKRGGNASVVFLDDETAETQHQLADPGLTAEQIFDARWAGALIQGAVARMRAEMEKAGKRELFDQLVEFVVGGKESSYLEVAQRTGLTIAATKAAIYRLRERYRELLVSELARTVSSPDDFDDEIRSLRNSLMNRRL
jgi:RNA polymerase sigma factor (sigma-70 family)